MLKLRRTTLPDTAIVNATMAQMMIAVFFISWSFLFYDAKLPPASPKR
jgi:hypothetical protein